MISQQMNRSRPEYADVFNLHVCPECGVPMVEIEKIKEGGFLFIWYECKQDDCDGQWLEKKKAVS